MLNTKKLLTMLAMVAISSMSMATSYQLQPIYLYASEEAKSTMTYLGASFNVSFPHAELPNTGQQTGHYGFGLSAAHLMPLNQTHWLGASLTFNSNAPSSFVSRNQLIRVSLHDFNFLGKYQYAFSDTFSMGISAGLGFVYGWASGAGNHFYGRFEPVIGYETLWRVAEKIALSFNYQHSFGVAASKAYQSRQSAPSIDRVSLGVSYVF